MSTTKVNINNVEYYFVYIVGSANFGNNRIDDVANDSRQRCTVAPHVPLYYVVIIKQNWNQFLLVVKATALKQQISNFSPQIQRTHARDHINLGQ